jgi:hypothetical protein
MLQALPMPQADRQASLPLLLLMPALQPGCFCRCPSTLLLLCLLLLFGQH